MIVFFNNVFCLSDLLEDKELEKKYEYVLKFCGMKRNMVFYIICDILEILNGFYVIKIGDSYYFYYDLVMEVIIYVFGIYYL